VFMGMLHLLTSLAIAAGAAAKLALRQLAFRGHLWLWFAFFVMVCLRDTCDPVGSSSSVAQRKFSLFTGGTASKRSQHESDELVRK
jgi:hypothetical protein